MYLAYLFIGFGENGAAVRSRHSDAQESIDAIGRDDSWFGGLQRVGKNRTGGTWVRAATSLQIEATAMLLFHNSASGRAMERSDVWSFMCCIA
jgi:hypothetical protein